MVKRLQIITAHSAIALCARRQDFLSANGSLIDLMISLVKISYQNSIKDGLGVPLGNRANFVNHYQKTEKKWRREMKTLKKQKNMLFTMADKSVSCHEIKKINKMNFKVSKKLSYSGSNISNSD